MIDSKKKISIYDDTGRGDEFEVNKILYEDDTIIVAEASNEWYSKPLKVIIYKEDGEVACQELLFYLAKNH